MVTIAPIIRSTYAGCGSYESSVEACEDLTDQIVSAMFEVQDFSGKETRVLVAGSGFLKQQARCVLKDIALLRKQSKERIVVRQQIYANSCPVRRPPLLEAYAPSLNSLSQTIATDRLAARADPSRPIDRVCRVHTIRSLR